MDTYSFNWLQLKEKERTSEEINDELVIELIGLLSNESAKYEELTYSEELESIAKVLKLVSESIDEELITESEAKNLVKYIVSGMISKRVTNIFDNLLTPTNQSHWFLAAGHKLEEKNK